MSSEPNPGDLKTIRFTMSPGMYRWAKVVRIKNTLPLPSEIRGAHSIPGYFLKEGDYTLLVQGDYLITAKEVNPKKNWGAAYSLYRVDLNETQPFVNIPFGSPHKTLIKEKGGHQDLLPGAGPAAAIVREIHALERGVLTVDESKRTPRKKSLKWIRT
jgi:hypothetical protein